ncbi:MAG: hypothetical protein C0615_00975 [Desulfuromonas sp.]|nr:MAG: hypothetical protein C0615_00975 [Desulfuromonas sp.]
MKKITLFSLLLTVLFCGTIASSARAAFQQVDFIASIKVEKPLSLAAGPDGTIYMTTTDGRALAVSADGEILREYGLLEKGEKPILKKAAGIAYADGIVYVTDSRLDKVVLFSVDGKLLDAFGKRGRDAKEFDDPTAITVRDSIIYVVDSGNDRVQLFGRNGVYIGAIGQAVAETEQLNDPVDLAVDEGGRLYVVDQSDSRVKIYNQDGSYAGQYSEPERPSSITIARDSVFVADDYHHTVTRIFFDNRPAESFGVKGEARAQFKGISGLFVNGLGHLFVADRKNDNIQSFAMEVEEGSGLTEPTPIPTWVEWMETVELSASGLFWDETGKRLLVVDDKSKSLTIVVDGQPAGVITVPNWKPLAAAVDSEGAIWTVDRGKNRLLKLGADGSILLEIGKYGSREGYFSSPSDLAITPDGLIYVADKGNHRVQAFNSDGVFLSAFGSDGSQALLKSPSALQIDPVGNLFVLDESSDKVVMFAPDGEPIREIGGAEGEPGYLKEPVAITLVADELMVLDEGQDCIKVFDVDGSFRRVFGSGGEGRGDFSKPVAMARISETELLVADAENGLVHKFKTHNTPKPVADVEVKAGMRKVKIEWSASGAADVEGYAIYRSQDAAGPYQMVATTNLNSYADADVEPGETYFYRVGVQTRNGQESPLTTAQRARPEKGRAAKIGEVSADPMEWSVTLSWPQKKQQPFLDHYNVYQQVVEGEFEKIGDTKETDFVAAGLDPSTDYVFRVTAVSIDDVETTPVEVSTTTLVATRPPIEIVEFGIDDIFSNTYKIYEDEGIGFMRIANNTGAKISSLKVSFAIKEFMDYPSEVEIKDLGPRSTKDVVLKAVFNNKILDVTEDTPVQTSIGLSYYENGELQSYSRNHAINIFEKHRMMWDVRERFATFVTPKDEVVLEFVRSVITQYPEVNDPILFAAALYDALGVVGLKYIQDPSNPYQMTSEDTDTIDYIQYPRETLNRRSGDCDDLVALFGAMLESLGIRTKVIEVPGHMFMMFATEFTPEDRPVAVADLFIEHEDVLWVPVEVTLVGSSFLKAWEKGSSNHAEWVGRNLDLMDIRTAWETYKPGSLVKSDWRPKEVLRSDIETSFDEFKMLKKIRMSCITKNYVDRARREPDNFDPYLQLGIIYAEEGEPEEALKLFEKARELDPENPAIYNNLGNIYYLQDKYTEAVEAYAAAVENDPADPYVLVNLARANLKNDQREQASQNFSRAIELSPEIAAKYRSMALELMSPL